MAPYPPKQQGQSDHRVQPFSEEAERGVLGSILLDPERVLPFCSDFHIGPDAFYKKTHQVLFELLSKMNLESRPIDLLTVGEHLRHLGKIEEVGGLNYLDQLVDSTPTTYHAEYYLRIVHNKYLLRSIIETSQNAIEACYTSDEEPKKLVGDLEEAVYAISSEQQTKVIEWRDLVHSAMEDIEEIYQRKSPGLAGLSTGFVDLDKQLLGMKPTEMIILAARPSMGKTSLALNIAENIATGKADGTARAVAVFSLEMSGDQLVKRMLCSRGKVPAHKLTGGYINDISHRELMSAADALTKAPIYMDDTAGIEALDMRSRARRMKEKYNIELIVVDYLQLMNFSQYAKEGRQRETAGISGAIKAMGKELNIPIIILSQLSRGPENRDRHQRPQLSDLRDSGSIEQDADVVLLLRRPSRIPNDPDHHDQTLAIIDVAKNRNGPTGEIQLNFFGEYTRFDNRTSEGDGGYVPDVEEQDEEMSF